VLLRDGTAPHPASSYCLWGLISRSPALSSPSLAESEAQGSPSGVGAFQRGKAWAATSATYSGHGSARAEMTDDDRTTPLGLFNYARSDWQSGVLLHDARAKVTHPDSQECDGICSSGSEPRNFLVVKCNPSGFEYSPQGSESMRIANMFFGFKIGNSPPMDACATRDVLGPAREANRSPRCFRGSGTWAGTGPSGVCSGVWNAIRS